MEEPEQREGKCVIFKDIRRYYCEFCGLCRSKKSLITSHILSHHQEEMEMRGAEGNGEEERVKSYTCDECDSSFSKNAYLKQHMQSHSLERPFTCPVDDCNSSYRRKDHLTRHLLQHQGKLFECSVMGCNRRFAFQGNMKRHVKELHDEESASTSSDANVQKQFVCPEIGCGKVFKYESKLRKHEDSHAKFEAVEVFCSEPGCMKYFSNEQCLKVHIQSCHQHITCEECGTKQLKKNMKRHIRMHKAVVSFERIECSFEDCLHTFSTRSNLNQHIKAAHLQEKPFACSIPGCGMRFPFKHVRDKHEKSACHVYIQGDFEESDEQFRMRPRGGRKRECPTIETLMRKRVVLPPNESDSIMKHESDFISWLLSGEADDE